MTDDEALKVLVALGDLHRFEIFRKLMDAPERPAGELIEGRAASTISHHLKILEDAGLVSAERQGRQNCYSLRPQTLAALAEWARESSQNAEFVRLSDYLDRNPT